MNKMNFISHDKLLHGFASRKKLHKLVESTAVLLSSTGDVDSASSQSQNAEEGVHVSTHGGVIVTNFQMARRVRRALCGEEDLTRLAFSICFCFRSRRFL